MKHLKRAVLYTASLATVASVNAQAAVPAELTAAVDQLKADGIVAISAIGGALLTLAGLAILFKWAKATFFG
jgi:uncharacterized protein (DUF2141 family)